MKDYKSMRLKPVSEGWKREESSETFMHGS